MPWRGTYMYILISTKADRPWRVMRRHGSSFCIWRWLGLSAARSNVWISRRQLAPGRVGLKAAPVDDSASVQRPEADGAFLGLLDLLPTVLFAKCRRRPIRGLEEINDRCLIARYALLPLGPANRAVPLTCRVFRIAPRVLAAQILGRVGKGSVGGAGCEIR